MEEKVGYAGEAPSLPSWAEEDWRLQEMLSMGPQAIMEELLGLSEEVRAAKDLWEETKFELRQTQERLKLMEAQVLQAAIADGNDQVAGKNAEVRARRAAIYLADHPTVKQLAFEVKPLESLEAAARLAMEERLDRSKNLHQWARMFEAQVKLLATVPAPKTMLEELGQAIAQVHREPFLADSLPEAADTRVIFDFAKQAENEVRHSAAHSVWVAARGWMSWYYNPVGSPPVDTAELIERIIEVQKPKYIGEEPEPDGARFASEVDELFPPDVQIPPSMDVSEEEVDDMKAAMDRYLPGDKVDESAGPSL